MDEAVQLAAERLRQAGTLRRPCPPVHRLLGGSREAAYAVQHLVTELQAIGGAQVWGRKVMALNGADDLECGTLTDTMLRVDGCTVTGRELVDPSIAACLVFAVEQRLIGTEDNVQIQRCVGPVRAALEILDRRVTAVDATSVDMIADNLSAGLLVLGDDVDSQTGPGPWKWRVLLGGTRLTAATDITWSDVAAALRELALVAVEHDRPLAAGEFVAFSSFGAAVPLVEDGLYIAEVDGRAAARVSFVASTGPAADEEAS